MKNEFTVICIFCITILGGISHADYLLLDFKEDTKKYYENIGYPYTNYYEVLESKYSLRLDLDYLSNDLSEYYSSQRFNDVVDVEFNRNFIYDSSNPETYPEYRKKSFIEFNEIFESGGNVKLFHQEVYDPDKKLPFYDKYLQKTIRIESSGGNLPKFEYDNDINGIVNYFNKIKEKEVVFNSWNSNEYRSANSNQANAWQSYYGLSKINSVNHVEEYLGFINKELADDTIELGSNALDMYLTYVSALKGYGYQGASVLTPIYEWAQQFDPHEIAIKALSLNCPVDLQIKDQYGNIYDKESDSNRIFYYEYDYLGEKRDMVFYADIEGELEINIIPDETSSEEDYFSLIAFDQMDEKFEMTWLAGDEKISESSLSYTYNLKPSDNPQSNPVPEPATFILFGSGIAGILAWKKRANQNN